MAGLLWPDCKPPSFKPRAAECFVTGGLRGDDERQITDRAKAACRQGQPPRAPRLRRTPALVYRYYGDRDNLVREVLKGEIAQRQAILERVPDTLGDALRFWYREAVESGGNLIKLLQREALDTEHVVVHRRRRRDYYRLRVEILRTWQETGRVSVDFDAPYLFLALLALITFPIGFPQLTGLVTGKKPLSPDFVDSWVDLLTQLARCVGDRADEASNLDES